MLILLNKKQLRFAHFSASRKVYDEPFLSFNYQYYYVHFKFSLLTVLPTVFHNLIRLYNFLNSFRYNTEAKTSTSQWLLDMYLKLHH